MQILSAIGDKRDYTWSESLRFFSIGSLKACGYGSIPALVAAWHNYTHYTDDTDWSLVWKLLATGIGYKLFDYWKEHRALLKMPPFWAIPAEFEPSMEKKELSEHITVVTKSPDGTTVTELSPHTTTTTKPAEPSK